MLTSLFTVPLVALMVGLPGTTAIRLPGFRSHARTPAVADTIPPHWRTASRLALEDQFVFDALAQRFGQQLAGQVSITGDSRRMRIDVDPDSGEVTISQELGEIPLGTTTRMSLAQYSTELASTSFRRQWQERSRQSINSLGANTPATGTTSSSGLRFEIPGLLPKQVQSLLGPGSPSLNVSGSENIRLSGESNWTNQQVGPLGQKRSLFPSLDMQQDLDIRLEGQLSDRIRVNLLQNSLNQIPLANRIAINYKGDEDDLIQELDLGNTNLSLPGTQYVSYSGRNEGLFGVKAASRFGPVDFTVLASKQEGRSERASYAGGSSRQTWTLYNHEYVHGVYFFLYDPDFETLEIPDNSINVYRDDGNYNTTDITIRGRAFMDPIAGEKPNPTPGDPDTLSLHGNFRQLLPGADQDFEILQNVYGPRWKILKMKQPLNYDQRLAVTYSATPLNPVGPPRTIGGDTLTYVDTTGVRTTELSMKLIRAPLSELKRDLEGDFLDSLGFTRVRHLELKNFYQLPGQRIDANTFKMDIKLGDDEPPRTSVTGVGAQGIPYIEVLGLDNFDETSGRPVPGHDTRVDGTTITQGVFQQTRLFVDYDNGLLYFLEPRPFAPRRNSPFEAAVDTILNRRAKLNGTVPGQNEPNPIIYDRYNPERKDAFYRLVVEFTAQAVAGEITLGRGNIIEGSEVVTVNGRQWYRDVDYTVDYDLGRISLKRQLGAADNLSIDYSYAPLFQQAGRTLIGSAFRYDGRNKSLGGAFLYESRGAQDIRPRLGEEPSRSLIGDVNGEWRTAPPWMTRIVDRLPGVRTTAPSEFNVQAEMGMSFPNPNTRNEVFLDDMEGVRDAVSVAMGAERWRWSSVPKQQVNGVEQSVNDVPGSHNAEVRWYSPFAVVKERDLKPNLTQPEGADNNRQILALSVPRVPKSFQVGDSMWVGVTYPLDASGIDLSKSQFIELWVDDFNDYHRGFFEARVRGQHVKLHIDLGTVSEDQQRAPDAPPNIALDSEDKGPYRDNQLVVTDAESEDTGYDGLLDVPLNSDNPPESSLFPPGGMRDLTTATPSDPQGDDFDEPDDKFKEIDPRRFRFTNGVEGNKVIFPYPDTEDLNLNNNIDNIENYFEYTIDLGNDNHPYLVTDLQRDPTVTVALDNGWRRYRIPIADTLRKTFGTPDLTLARHVRVWLEGIRVPDDTTAGANPDSLVRPFVMLGSLEIVGSRWRSTPLAQSDLDAGSTVTLNSVNSVDNAEIYEPPFDPGETRNGNQAVTRREQSLALEFTALRPGMKVEAFKTLSIEEDYTRYKQLGFYTAGFEIENYTAVDTALYYFVRFASDEIGFNYYEYRARVPESSLPNQIHWEQILLPLTQLSNIKLDAPITSGRESLTVAGERPGELLSVVGRPSFTRLRRISFGLINGSNRDFRQGQLWFNELRATDVEKTVGRAQRVLVNGKLSNLITYSASYNNRDPHFLSVGETRGTGSTNDQFTANGAIELHRFFEGTGIVLPLTYGYSLNTSTPRFTAGDDVVRTGAYADASQSRSDAVNWSLAYSRVWSERSNPLLRYTIGGITAGINRNVSRSNTPSTVDTSTATNTYVNYRQSFRKLLAIPLPFTRAKLYPFPEQVTWGYNENLREQRTYDRLRDSSASLVLRNRTNGRAASLGFGVDLRPIDMFSYHLDGLRNLSLENLISEQLWGFNVGRNTNLRQATNATYTISRLGAFIRPALTWNTSYAQDNGPQVSNDLSVRQIANSSSYAVRWDLPFDGLAQRGGIRDTVRRRPSIRKLISRLGNISADIAINRGSAYSRILGSPSPMYLFGFTDDPGFGGEVPRTEAAFGNQVGRNRDWRSGARTRVDVGFGASVTGQVEFTSRVNETNGVQQRNDTARYPELQVDYGRLSSVLLLDRFLANPQLHTNFSRNRQTLYQNDSPDPTSVSTSSEWRPLLKMNGALKSGPNVELGIERRNTQRENFQLGHSVQTDRQTTVIFSLNRSYTQGQKVSVLGRTSTVRSQINMGISANYDRRSGETRILPGGTQTPGVRNPQSEDRLSVQGNGSYGFSTNVTGTATLGFQQNRDLQRDIVRRSIRVELRGSFNF